MLHLLTIHSSAWCHKALYTLIRQPSFLSIYEERYSIKVKHQKIMTEATIEMKHPLTMFLILTDPILNIEQTISAPKPPKNAHHF